MKFRVYVLKSVVRQVMTGVNMMIEELMMGLSVIIRRLGSVRCVKINQIAEKETHLEYA